MASVTLTVSTIDGVTPANSLQAIDSKDIVGFTSSDNLSTGTAVLKVLRYKSRARGSVPKEEKWVCTQSYATVQAAINAADAEAGAQLLTQKATDFSAIDDDAYPTTEAVVESFQPIWYVAATGTDTYSATLTGVVPTAYYAGMTIHATFANANSGGASTINVNALGAKAITKNISTALAANDIAVGKVYELKYDGTRFQIDSVDKAPIDAPTFTGVPAAPTAATGTNTTQIATTAFVQNKKAPLGTATGTDTYAVTLAPVITVAIGCLICVRFTNASSGASTLNVAAGGAVAIVKKDGSTAIGAGDIAANTWYQLLHDGTSWVALGI